MLALITSQNDQDEAGCLDWVRDMTTEQIIEYWFFLNKRFEDPRLEVMSRMAIIQYTKTVAIVLKERNADFNH